MVNNNYELQLLLVRHILIIRDWVGNIIAVYMLIMGSYPPRPLGYTLGY